MRIAVIAHHVGPIAAPFIGGVESHTASLAAWLAARGHEVTLFAPPGSKVAGTRFRPLDLELGGRGVSLLARRDVSTMPEAFLGAHHAYLEVMLELAEDCPFDAVHVNTLHYLPVAMAHTLPVRPVLTLHCPPTPWLESAIRVASARGPLPMSVVAVSSALATTWSHAVPAPTVIPNGVDLDGWVPGHGGDGAVWAGRIVPEKAPHTAIDAARLAGLSITLAGPIIDRDYWTSAVVPRLGDDATYAGHLDHPQLVELLGSARVAIQSPAWDEPFGLAAAEAIACGTPVAAFARGGLPDVVHAASGALTGAADAVGLADAIGRAVSLDREDVRADAERRLGIQAMGLAYEDLYRRTAALPRPPRDAGALALDAAA